MLGAQDRETLLLAGISTEKLQTLPHIVTLNSVTFSIFLSCVTFSSFRYLVRIVINLWKISAVRNQQLCDALKQIFEKFLVFFIYSNPNTCLLFRTNTNSLCLYSRGFRWKTLVPSPLCKINTDLIQPYRVLTQRKIFRTIWSRSRDNAKPITVVMMSIGNMSNRKTDKVRFQTIVSG